MEICNTVNENKMLDIKLGFDSRNLLQFEWMNLIGKPVNAQQWKGRQAGN